MSNYPRTRKDLLLDERQRAVFDAHVYLVRVAVARFRKFVPPSFIDDLRQSLLVALTRAALAADLDYVDPKTGNALPFGPFAWRAVLNAARNFCFSKNHRFENHALRNAERFELSADEPIGVLKSGEEMTCGSLADTLRGDREVQSFTATDALDSRRSEVREAIAGLKTLTAFERRVTNLRFVEGLSADEVTKKVRFSRPVVNRALHAAVVKLRAHFASLGLKTLPPGAPIPRVDYEQAPGVRS